MVSGTQWPGGDPFLQRQNEPSIAVSSANSQHLLAGANDYRTVDIPDPFLGPAAEEDGRRRLAGRLQVVRRRSDLEELPHARLPAGHVRRWARLGGPVPGARREGALQRGGRLGGPGRYGRHVLLRRHRVQARFERRARRRQSLHRPERQGGHRRGRRHRPDPVDRREGHRPGRDVVRRQALDRSRRSAGRRAHLQRPEVRALVPGWGDLRGLGPHLQRHLRGHHVLPLSRLRRDLERATQAERPEGAGEPGGVRVGRPTDRLRLRRVAPVRNFRSEPEAGRGCHLRRPLLQHGAEVHPPATDHDLRSLRSAPGLRCASAPRCFPASPPRWTPPGPAAGRTSPGRSAGPAETARSS